MTETIRSNDQLRLIKREGANRVIKSGVPAAGSPGVGGGSGAAGSGFTWRGAWSNTTAYAPYDVVCYETADGGDGVAYVCIQAGTGHVPNGDDSYWNTFAERGESGVDSGPAGTWKGLWTSGTVYAIGDIVRGPASVGDQWKALTNHTAATGNKPGSGAGAWEIYLKDGHKGANGVSITGPKGDTGATGAAGAAGTNGTNGKDSPAGVGFTFTDNGTASWVAPNVPVHCHGQSVIAGSGRADAGLSVTYQKKVYNSGSNTYGAATTVSLTPSGFDLAPNDELLVTVASLGAGHYVSFDLFFTAS